MQIRDIAWSSLKRRKARFAFVLAALAIGVGTTVAMSALTRSMQAEVSDELDRFGANIIITPKTGSLDLGYGGLPIGGVTVDAQELRMADIPAIRTIPNKRNISAVAPKLIGTLDLNGQRIILIGADLAQERLVKSWWKVAGRFAVLPTEAMVGAEATQILHTAIGDVITLGGRTVTVTGLIAATGSLDDRAVFADLALAQHALGRPGGVSLIEVSALCGGCPIEDIVAQIGAALPHARVAPIRQAVAARERAMLQFTRFGYAVSLVVLLVGIMVVMSAMMSSVTERTAEIGILRAVGFRQWQVARMLLIETVAISVAGGISGWLLGSVAARFAGPVIAQLENPVALPWALAGPAVLLAVLVGTIGGIYPALRAARMDPAHALRYL